MRQGCHVGRARRTRSAPPQGIAAAAGRLAAAALLAAGCSALGPEPPGPGSDAFWARAPEPPAGQLVVRLAFGASADLDLYVTGPRAETVYFANSPSKLGGRLRADLRCDAPAPRIETVVFPIAPAGLYRVGVDFPERCRPSRAAGFSVEVRSRAGRREIRGRIERGRFQPAVLEWQEPAAAERATRPPGRR